MKTIYIGCMASQGIDNGFTKAMRAVCGDYEEISVSEPNLNERIHKIEKADLVFIQIQATGITKESIEHLKSIGAFVINWSGDKRLPLPQFYLDMASWGVDLTCFSNAEDVQIMVRSGYRSDFLQIGVDAEIYCPKGEKYPAPEIVFMGNNCGGFPLSGLRQEMVSFLKTHYGSMFGVYGSGWAGFESGNYMGDQYGEACIYRGAKIAINLSHFDCDRYSSDRLLRALGTGICVLSHKYTGIDKDFKIGTELDVWDDLDDLVRVIDYYLVNDFERLKIAKNANEIGMKLFTFQQMAENIIKLYEKHGK